MDEWEKVREKLNCICDRGYVEAGVVESLTNFFCVPKGEDDIRMVYDGTASGLNDALWAPWFPLPTVESLLRAVEPGTYMCDTDVGEVFLNFMLHEEVRKMCGVDFTLYYPEEVGQGVGNLWERWCRCAMGLTTSPYQAIQGMMWAKELMMGNRLDESNVFRWSKLQMNLPGMTGYDPTKMWLCKVRKDDIVACDISSTVMIVGTQVPLKQNAGRRPREGRAFLESSEFRTLPERRVRRKGWQERGKERWYTLIRRK